MSNEFFNYSPFYTYVSGISHFKRFVEIGVYKGTSCIFMAKRLIERGTPFELYAIDLWNRVNTKTDYTRQINESVFNEFTASLQRENLRTYVNIINDDSAKAAAHFPDRSVDFAFIDANHDYAHVKADIQAWMPKIKIGGMLSGHDYGEATCGVKPAVDELLADRISLLGTCWYTFIK